MPDQRERPADERDRQRSTVAAGVRSSKRRPPLHAALDLDLEHSFEDALRIATDGGRMTASLRNTGLAPSFQGFVQLVRVTYRLSVTGIFVFQDRDDGSPFWRRSRRGEVLPPDAVLAHRPGSRRFHPETFVDTQALRTALAAVVPAPTLAPREAVSVGADVPAVSTADEGEGLWSWCLAARCFDVLQEPPVPVVVPTPEQVPHHRRLLCLHDLID